jgi:uncharacterized protein YdhG (YjbR/CyaY superfamily)
MKQDKHNKPAKRVDDYLAAVPEEERAVLENLRMTINNAAPKAEVTIGY